MTAREVFEGMLIECSKVNAPSLLLSEFNYYFNKAINNYINKRYNIYDINQQTTDDIRVLKATAIINGDNLSKVTSVISDETTTSTSATSYLSTAHSLIGLLQGATYEVNLPKDYLHLLNCMCVYKVKKNWKCFDGGSYVLFPAKRLTSDAWSTISTDWYNRPTPERPYYYIHNVNANSDVPTNPILFDNSHSYVEGTDMVGVYGVTSNGLKISSDGVALGEGNYDLTANDNSNFARVVNTGDSNINVSTVQKATGYRYGNPSNVRMEIRYGKDDSVFELVEVAVDYIKSPQHIRLTQEQMDATEDYSLIMEFPDYVCQEIINELTILVMARTGDPLINSFIPVNLTIANPAQALSQPQVAQQSSEQS